MEKQTLNLSKHLFFFFEKLKRGHIHITKDLRLLLSNKGEQFTRERRKMRTYLTFGEHQVSPSGHSEEKPKFEGCSRAAYGGMF